MLTFGDNILEQSSTEENKKGPKKFLKITKDSQSQFTQDSESQIDANKISSCEQNSNSSNSNNNIKDEGKEIFDEENTKNNAQDIKSTKNIDEQQIEIISERTNENITSAQEAPQFRIMSPRNLNRQIQKIDFAFSNNVEQTNIPPQQIIFQTKESPKKSSNMVFQLNQNQQQQQQQQPIQQQNEQQIYLNNNNILRFTLLQLGLILQISSCLIVNSMQTEETNQNMDILSMILYALIGICMLFLHRFQRIQQLSTKEYLQALFRLITLVVYIETSLVQHVITVENQIDIYFKEQIQDINNIRNQNKSSKIKESIPSLHYQLIQLLFIGIMIFIQIYELFNTFLKRSQKQYIIFSLIGWIYFQLRICELEKQTIVYQGLISLFLVLLLTVYDFKKHCIIEIINSQQEQNKIHENTNYQQQAYNNNQFPISPRFGGFQTNQNELNNKNDFFYFNNNQNINVQNIQNQDYESQPKNNIQINNNNNFFSPKQQQFMHESLQYITPRDELDSKRNIDDDIGKSEINSAVNINNTNPKRGLNSQEGQNNKNNQARNNNNNQNFDQIYPSFQYAQFQNKDFESQQPTLEQQGSEGFDKKTLECVNKENHHEEREGYDYDQNYKEYDDNIQESDDNNNEIILDQADRSDAIKQINKKQSSQSVKSPKNISNNSCTQLKSKPNNIPNKNKKSSSTSAIQNTINNLQLRLEIQDMILNDINNGIIVVSKTLNEVIYVNRQACQNLNCSVDKVFSTLLSLKNIYALKDEISNFAEILQQFDNPLELSQLSTMRGLYMNHDKQKEVMICILNSQNGLSSLQQNTEINDATASFSQKENDNQFKQRKNSHGLSSFSIKNYLDLNVFLEIEVDQIKRDDDRFIIFNIRNITWNNPINVIHTTTLKVQYFIRKMISELSIDMSDIREYFNNMSNQNNQKIDYNGCIGKIDCMTEFLQDFATSSLMISSTFAPIKTQVNLQSLIQNVIEKVRFRTTQNQYTFSLQYDSNCPIQITSDQKRLERVFYNLILYFIDTNEKASIKIKVIPHTSEESHNEKRKISVQILCNKKIERELEENTVQQVSNDKKKDSIKKRSEGIKFSLTQKKACIANVYMLENMHYGVLLSNSIIQKLEPTDQGIYFQSGATVSFYFLLSQ